MILLNTFTLIFKTTKMKMKQLAMMMLPFMFASHESQIKSGKPLFAPKTQGSSMNGYRHSGGSDKKHKTNMLHVKKRTILKHKLNQKRSA